VVQRLGWRLTPMRTYQIPIHLLLLLALAGPALAVDGVLEINQACAVNTGCFAGDTAGYPVTITDAGSYRLTSNVILPDLFTDAIHVSKNDVAIDLNGFTIYSEIPILISFRFF